MTGNSQTEHRLTIQVADVNRALLSVSKAVDGGNRVVFSKDWSDIEDMNTGERTTLSRRGGLYVLDTWVRSRPNDGRPENARSSNDGRKPPFGGQDLRN